MKKQINFIIACLQIPVKLSMRYALSYRDFKKANAKIDWRQPVKILGGGVLMAVVFFVFTWAWFLVTL